MSCAIKISIYRSVGVVSLLVLFGIASEASAQGSGRADALAAPQAGAERAQKAQQSYNECTSRATAAVKSGKLRIEDLPAEFGRCTDRFPAAGLFQECKKNLLKSAKGRDISVAEVNRCKQILVAASFDPSQPAPIYVSAGQAVFAGVGLNRPMKVSVMQVPNYDCRKLQMALSDIPKNAQHILFGNHPKMFLSGPDQAKFLKNLSSAVSKPSKNTKHADVAAFGRVFGDPKTNQSIVYFPSGACEFEATTGKIFAGINLFYLPDEKSQSATPYFGIAYYKQGQKSITTPELVAEVSRKLGPDFKAYSKDVQTVFISSTPFKEVDKERDPRNICELPRQHRFVAVIHTVKGSPNVPEYLLLANIRNLCEYGDLRARNLARQ
jgi:hypothetical protein